MPRPRGLSVLTPVVLLCLGVARGEEQPPVDPLSGREAAAIRSFLTAGPAPLRPQLPDELLARAEQAETRDAVHGALRRWRLPALAGQSACVLELTPTGDVVAFRQPAPAGPAPSLAPTVLRARAWAALGRCYPDLPRRCFRLLPGTPDPAAGRVAFSFVEEPSEGVLAVYPNRARLELDRRSGELLRARVSQLRHEVRAAPPIDEAQAVAVARRATRVEDYAPASANLVVRRIAPGRCAPFWAVCLDGDTPRPAFLRVHAETGRPSTRWP